MTNILVLGAGIYQVPLIKAIKKRGYVAHVVSPEGNYPGLKIADKVLFSDTRNSKNILDYCLKNNIHGVTTSGTDVAVRTLGYLVDNGNFLGPNQFAAERTTDKVLMKSALIEADINTAKFKVVSTFEEVLCAVETMQFPLMVKAPDTSGSRGISKVDSAISLKHAFYESQSVSSSNDVIVEEFLDGIEIGAQAVVISDQLIDVIIHGDLTTPPPVSVPVGHYLPLEISEELIDKVRRVVAETVSALKITNSICNFDFMIVDNEPYIIELGSRMGATCIPENIQAFKNVNYYDLLIDICLGGSVKYHPSVKNECTVSKLLYSNFDSVVPKLSIPKVLDKDYECHIQIDKEVGSHIEKFVNGTNRYGHIIVNGPNLDKCFSIAGDVFENINNQIIEAQND